jgi:HK97 family phage major capsid protein
MPPTRSEALAVINAARKVKLTKKSNTTQKSATEAAKRNIFGSETGAGPHIRTGEDPLTSRGYSFARFLSMVTKTLDPDLCKTELNVSKRLRAAMADCHSYHTIPGGFTAPLCPAFLMGDRHGIVDNAFGYELKSLLWAGQGVHDPEQQAWLTAKMMGGDGATMKAYTPDTEKNPLSWQQQNVGGAVIDFPTMGPIIPLLRSKNALMSAGAEVLPLGPNGRMAWPRETSPATYTWLGENTDGSESQIGTDQFLLSAKKIMALVRMPNELIRFGGPAAEQIARNSMTTSIALGLDYTLLHSDGGPNVPTGLLNYPGITTFAPSTAASGNTAGILAPNDLYNFIGQIEAHNAGVLGGFGGWIMRPELKSKFLGARSGVYNGSAVAAQGNFLFDITRSFDPARNRDVVYLSGYPITDTAQVSNTRPAGNTSNSTCLFGGVWSDYKIGM